MPKKIGKEKIAAIVMNANPFTLGHRYLVECASKEADFLILFVVEEDAFFDCNIFAQYIAPRLGISKRFVGEESFDTVTRQYNEQMKEILPKYGIELAEIPRRKIEAKEISATRVRALYQEKQWEDLKKLVPHSTFIYLHEQAGMPWEIEEEDSEFKKEVCLLLDIVQKQQNWMKSLDEFLKSEKRLVIYGIGSDGDTLLSLLPNKLSKNVVFCDKKAIKNEIWFHGIKVIAPECIMGDDLVYIATRKYTEEVYRNLLENGIEINNIGIMGKIEKDATA